MILTNNRQLANVVPVFWQTTAQNLSAENGQLRALPACPEDLPFLGARAKA